MLFNLKLMYLFGLTAHYNAVMYKGAFKKTSKALALGLVPLGVNGDTEQRTAVYTRRVDRKPQQRVRGWEGPKSPKAGVA